jgi:hypothetical protein
VRPEVPIVVSMKISVFLEYDVVRTGIQAPTFMNGLLSPSSGQSTKSWISCAALKMNAAGSSKMPVPTGISIHRVPHPPRPESSVYDHDICKNTLNCMFTNPQTAALTQLHVGVSE